MRRIHGEILGYGRNADAHHITAPVPGGAGAAACMQLALDDAGLDASGIGHVNAHGTSTPLNDATEAEAIRKVFGDAPPPVTSTKGVTGHMIAGAGAAEAVIALLSFRDGIVPPTANLERIGDDIGLDVVAGSPRPVDAQPGAVELVRVRWPQRHADPGAGRPPRRDRGRMTATPVFGAPQRTVAAALREIDGRPSAGSASRAASTAARSGPPRARRSNGRSASRSSSACPIVGRIASSGADVAEGVASLHAWGRVAKALTDASGVVPDRCSCSWARRCRARPCCSASSTT